MMTKRMGHTGREMKASGEWASIGRKHYRHISGVEVRYNCNRWMWEIVGHHNQAWTALWVAKHYAEQLGLATMPPAGGVQ